jgi:CRISPR type III-A-associated RAMP protein Csm4
MDIAILKCKPSSQFHFGVIAHDENMALDNTAERLHSDTMFSALVNEYNRIWENDENLDTEGFVKAFDCGEIKIASASYCIENDGRYLFFLPKPAHATLLVEEDFKSIKRIKFVSQTILEQTISPANWNSEKCAIIQDKFVCTKEELTKLDLKFISEKYDYGDLKLFQMHDETKVKVHTTNQEDRLYNQTNLLIADNTAFCNLKVHFWLAYELGNIEAIYAKRFKQLLQMLPHTGIGGQRSTGSGFFDTVEFLKLNYSVPQNTNAFLSLSVLKPKNEDEFEKLMYFDVSLRGGRIIKQYTPNVESEPKAIKLKRTRVINEGAVCKEEINGNIVDIAPKSEERKFLRYGKSIFIPIYNVFEHSL